MTRTFGQWFRFLAASVVVGFLVSTVCASLGATQGQVRNEVRMDVDFTVLPIVLPDGSEAPAPVDPDAIEGESTLPPEATAPQQAAATPEPLPAPDPLPAPEPAPTKPAPAPAPESDPSPVAEAGPGTIRGIGLDESPEGFTITIRADRAVGDTSYLNLDKPKRLVIDLRNAWTMATRNVVRSKGVVKHIVVGEHPDRLRLVVHFNKMPEGRITPTFERAGTTLRVKVAYP